jgi:hypothetical protein
MKTVPREGKDKMGREERQIKNERHTGNRFRMHN